MVISLALVAIGIASVFNDGQKSANEDVLLDNVRKDHSNRYYEVPADSRLVEIDFGNELEEGDMRGLKVGEGKDEKVLIAKY